MNDKINVNGIIYDQLGKVKVNNREYVFGLNNNDLEFFEQVNDENGIKYNTLNKDLTLMGNAGTSLTRLNERIVMTHLADNLKNEIRIGKLNNPEEIAKEFSSVQHVVDENPDVIKKLLKGNASDLTEEKFNQRRDNLVNYFDIKTKEDDFDIVDDAPTNTVFDLKPITKDEVVTPELPKASELDSRTQINADMYEQINKQIEEDKNTDLDNTTILAPETFGPRVEEPVPSVEPIAPEEPLEETKPSFMGIDDEKISNEDIDAILAQKRDKISPEQATYLENLKASRLAKEPAKEETKIEELPKQLVKKPDNKAAYVDTVILCLVTQLSIFGLLIFVLLLIK